MAVWQGSMAAANDCLSVLTQFFTPSAVVIGSVFRRAIRDNPANDLGSDDRVPPSGGSIYADLA